MKKLFLAVAMIAATISLNAAQTYTFGVSGETEFTSNYSNYSSYTITTDVDGVTFKNVNIIYATDATGYCTLNSSPIKFSGGTSTSSQWKVYSNYIQPNGPGRVLSITTNVGDVVSIVLKDAIDLANTTISGGTYTGTNIAAGGTFTITATGSEITITCTNSDFKPKFQTITCVVADVNDAISSSLLKKVANELVNPTNLEVEVYSVSGVKVLSSSAASISVSGLANGAYIAKTAEGTLKFVK